MKTGQSMEDTKKMGTRYPNAHSIRSGVYSGTLDLDPFEEVTLGLFKSLPKATTNIFYHTMGNVPKLGKIVDMMRNVMIQQCEVTQGNFLGMATIQQDRQLSKRVHNFGSHIDPPRPYQRGKSP